MPLEPTFWAQLFGMVTDKYGINWMVGYGDVE
jgi:PhnB protein